MGLMISDDPITVWMDQLRNADDLAANKLWSHFVCRLHELAREKLRPKTRRVYDEEDAAQSALHSVFAGLLEGRFPDLRDRNSLWSLMLVITSRKISNRHRYDQQQRRDVRRTLTKSMLKNTSDSSIAGDDLVANEPTPEFAEEFTEVCGQLYDCLEDASLKEIALMRIEGYLDGEIADRLNCSRRTVQRRLEIIRRQWKEWVNKGG